MKLGATRVGLLSPSRSSILQSSVQCVWGHNHQQTIREDDINVWIDVRVETRRRL